MYVWVHVYQAIIIIKWAYRLNILHRYAKTQLTATSTSYVILMYMVTTIMPLK